MNTKIEQDVFRYIRDELGTALTGQLDVASDLMEIVDWEKMPAEEGVHMFIWYFCLKFRIEDEQWKEYYSWKKGIVSGLFRLMSPGGPDYEYFLNLDLSSVPVTWLLDIAESKRWVYPFTDQFAD